MSIRSNAPLDGQWRFSPDPHADGEELGFWRGTHDDALWPEVAVPSCFDVATPGMADYEGICWYRRTFRLPVRSGERTILRFEGVNYRARVWINDQFLGENTDPFLPFEFDISRHVVTEGENVLAVSVDNAPHEGDVPAEYVQWHGFGGILREVFLYTTDPLRVERLRVEASPAPAGGRLVLSAQVANGRNVSVDATVAYAVSDAAGRDILNLTSHASIPAHSLATLVAEGLVPDALLWSPATPSLYRVEARLNDATRITDSVSTRFGFRRIEATPTGLRLNGIPLFLTGFNRHEDSPSTAMAVDRATARRDFEQMKEAGANFVRLCHYPHHPSDLDFCDEIGLLVLAEIPLNLKVDAARFQTAARQMTRLIERDANHPCIVFWSAGNETFEEDPAVAAWIRDLVRLARSLDPTRLCVHVSFRWQDHPNFEADDVICINYYPSITAWHGRRCCSPASDLSQSAATWRRALAALHERYPDKPILISEFGFCSFAGTFGHAMGEDLHERVVRAEYPAFDLPYLCGTTLWCWADHPASPQRFLDGLRMSPFGAMTRDRQPKRVFHAVRELFRKRQGLETNRP